MYDENCVEFDMDRLDLMLGELAKGYLSFYDYDGCPFRVCTPVRLIVEGKEFGADPNYPVLNIPNKELFLVKLQEFLDAAREYYKRYMDYYVDDEAAYDRVLISFLLYSATNADLDNIYSFLDHRTAMLRDRTIKEGVEVVGDYCGSELHAKFSRSGPGMEGPMGVKFFFEGGETSAGTHCLFFGIDGDTVKICTIQDPALRGAATNKKLDRYVRKLNKGVDPQADIAQVSPMALATLTMFIRYMRERGFTKFEAPNYMPIRYYGEIAMSKFNKRRTPQVFHAIEEEQDRIQHNMTERFSQTILRYAHHFDNVEISVDPAGTLHLLISGEPTIKDDNIIYALDGAIRVGDREKAEE